MEKGVAVVSEEGVATDLSIDALDDRDLGELLLQFDDDSFSDLDLPPDPCVPRADHLLQPPDSASPAPAASELCSPDSVSSFASYLEKFLMDDAAADSSVGRWEKEMGEDAIRDFSSDVLIQESESRAKSDLDNQEAEGSALAVIEEEKGDDPVRKKQRRKMRNKEHLKRLELSSLRRFMAENMARRQSLQFQKSSLLFVGKASQSKLCILFFPNTVLLH
ncbi:hypothetical protein AXF42_Ash018852 [Apostasia shenzhenica]|uniref:Uncharacterized protein n=1 Tax=Apostasia shenzhenica TaxID=1088818 RepID=A0A2I0B4Z1_9ASPA|nr:hypothetical protein AXF42_Ash018852 [Apostasia shenzhenica]